MKSVGWLLRFFAWDLAHDLSENRLKIVDGSGSGEVIFVPIIGSLGVDFELIAVWEKELPAGINDFHIPGGLIFEKLHGPFLSFQKFLFGGGELRDLEETSESFHRIKTGGGPPFVAFGNLLKKGEGNSVTGQSRCHRLELPDEGAAGLLKSGLGNNRVDQHCGETEALGFADHFRIVVAFATRHPSAHEEDHLWL